ncbi:MAG: zinc ABC transporter substrate-binding protein [Gammaproteobacteria bacterium]|jgi:zinc transport system substrate-binding protein
MLINLFSIVVLFINVLFSTSLLAEQSTKPTNIRVIATIKPLYNLTAAIMHNTKNKPLLLLNGNVSPHDYALKLSDVEVIKQANLIVWGGPDLEFFLTKLLKKPSLANKLLTIQTLKNINKLSFRKSTQLDEHLWLSPDNAKVIVEAITQNLITLDPANANQYLTNKRRFLTKLSFVDLRIRTKLYEISGQSYVVFHDAYQYFEKFYGLKQPLVISDHPELPLSMQRMISIHDSIKKHQIKCLFKEPQFNPKMLDFLLETTATTEKLKIGILDPLGSDQDLGVDGYFKLLNNLSDGLYSCLK